MILIELTAAFPESFSVLKNNRNETDSAYNAAILNQSLA